MNTPPCDHSTNSEISNGPALSQLNSSSIPYKKVILLGETGAGKSTLGNLLCPTGNFIESGDLQSKTTDITNSVTYVDKIKSYLQAFDTPGFLDN